MSQISTKLQEEFNAETGRNALIHEGDTHFHGADYVLWLETRLSVRPILQAEYMDTQSPMLALGLTYATNTIDVISMDRKFVQLVLKEFGDASVLRDFGVAVDCKIPSNQVLY